MNESQDKSEQQALIPELGVDELRNQLEIAKSQLETEQLRVKNIELQLEAQRERLREEVSLRQTLDVQLQEKTTQHETIKDSLKEKADELQALKARRFNPNDLAKIGIGLFILLVIGSVVVSYYILIKSITWWQTCAVLGLYLFCSAFAAISMRLLSDRCK